jgi:hypothetical protein
MCGEVWDRASRTRLRQVNAVQKEAGSVCYIHGHMAVFQHEEQDVRSFRMFTSQMIGMALVQTGGELG